MIHVIACRRHHAVLGHRHRGFHRTVVHGAWEVFLWDECVVRECWQRGGVGLGVG